MVELLGVNGVSPVLYLTTALLPNIHAAFGLIIFNSVELPDVDPPIAFKIDAPNVGTRDAPASEH